MKAMLVILSLAVLAIISYAVYLDVNGHGREGLLVILALLAFVVAGLAIGKYDHKRSIRNQKNTPDNQKV